MHREKRPPLTILQSRRPASIGTEPFATGPVDQHRKNIFIGEPIGAGIGMTDITGLDVDFMDTQRGTDPEGITRRVIDQGTGKYVFTDFKKFLDPRQAGRHLGFRRWCFRNLITIGVNRLCRRGI